MAESLLPGADWARGGGNARLAHVRRPREHVMSTALHATRHDTSVVWTWSQLMSPKNCCNAIEALQVSARL